MLVVKGLRGSIYVLIHPTQNGYVKIGKTKLTADGRAYQLTQQAGTALVGSYVVAYYEKVENCHLVEKLIHKVLHKKRVSNDREFFAISVREAIEKVRYVIEKLKNQQEIDLGELNSSENWWENLGLTWRQIFKKHLPLDFDPTDSELIEGINNIIFYSRDENLRSKICEFLKKRDFQQRIGNWYNKLSKAEKKEIKTFLMHSLQNAELEQIMNLSKLDCNGNLMITDLNPIIPLGNLKELNCSNTSITDLDSLANKTYLEVLDISYTAVISLEALEKLEHIRLVRCNHTDILHMEIERFKAMKPNCEVLKNQLDKLL